MFFDVEGGELDQPKWTWLADTTDGQSESGFDGIDYQCGHIHATWLANFTSFDNGVSMQRMQEPTSQ